MNFFKMLNYGRRRLFIVRVYGSEKKITQSRANCFVALFFMSLSLRSLSYPTLPLDEMEQYQGVIVSTQFAGGHYSRSRKVVLRLATNEERDFHTLPLKFYRKLESYVGQPVTIWSYPGWIGYTKVDHMHEIEVFGQRQFNSWERIRQSTLSERPIDIAMMLLGISLLFVMLVRLWVLGEDGWIRKKASWLKREDDEFVRNTY